MSFASQKKETHLRTQCKQQKGAFLPVELSCKETEDYYKKERGWGGEIEEEKKTTKENQQIMKTPSSKSLLRSKG